MTGLTARAATAADIEAICRIYNQGIEDRVGTFETTLRRPGDIAPWLDRGYPLVVVDDPDAGIVAWAAASAYRARPHYAGVGEFSVYVAREHRGRGAGRLAMDALIAASEALGLWKLLSRIFVENAASRALMRSVGFREVGIYERHGQLDGRWRDCVIVERLLEKALR